MEMKSLNKDHKRINESFVKTIEGFIYRITDDHNFRSFNHFKPVLTNAQTLHNNIGKELESLNIDESEWVFMFPNYLLFAGMGFAAAMKKQHNEDFINDETEKLFEEIQATLNDLEIMLDKVEFKKIKNKLKQTNND